MFPMNGSGGGSSSSSSSNNNNNNGGNDLRGGSNSAIGIANNNIHNNHNGMSGGINGGGGSGGGVNGGGGSGVNGSSGGGGSVKSRGHWSKHGLEGDGNFTKLFQYLFKKNKNLDSCQNVLIPDTVVYEHSFPTGWYSTVQHDNNYQINKKSGKDLETKAIKSEFMKHYDKLHNIVACFLSQTEDADGNQMNCVEFLDEDELDNFLFKKKVREKGILQRFITPKGPYNFSIQAIWSPHVIMLERRVNIHRINDKKIGSFERAVTYEGPSHFSNEVFCAPHLEKEIKKVCNTIVEHFANVEHKQITRMVLYFKVCNKGLLWLLWASSIRISGSTHHSNSNHNNTSISSFTHLLPESSRNYVPLNLSPRFVKPTMATQDLCVSDVDKELAELERSDMFSQELTSRQTTKTQKTLLKNNRFQNSPTTSPVKEKDSAVSHFQEKKEDESKSVNLSMNEEEEEIFETLEDILYTVYSFFLQGSEDQYTIKIPKQIIEKFIDRKDSFDHLLRKCDIFRPDVIEMEDKEYPEEEYICVRRNGSISKHQFIELKNQLIQLYKGVLEIKNDDL